MGGRAAAARCRVRVGRAGRRVALTPHSALDVPVPCRLGDAQDLLCKLLGDPVRVFTTPCVQAELRGLGREYEGEEEREREQRVGVAPLAASSGSGVEPPWCLQ